MIDDHCTLSSDIDIVLDDAQEGESGIMADCVQLSGSSYVESLVDAGVTHCSSFESLLLMPVGSVDVGVVAGVLDESTGAVGVNDGASD